MPQNLKLETITSETPMGCTSLDAIVKERQMIKTQLKLLHIAAFERDLARLNSIKLSLNSIALPDFYLTPAKELIVPVESRITNKDENNITLDTYFVYLNISEDIKQSLFSLLSGKVSDSFCNHLGTISTPEFREGLEVDKRKLNRLLKEM